MGILFGLLATLLGIIAAANWLTPLGWIVTGLAVGFAVLTAKAFWLASVFQDEANGDLSWFTKANLDDQEMKMLTGLTGGLVAGLSTEWAMFWQMGKAVTSQIADTMSKAYSTAMVGSATGVLFAAGTDLVGSAFLAEAVTYYTGQQEGDVIT